MTGARSPDQPLLPEPRPPARRWLRAFWIAIVLGYVLLFAVGFPRVGIEDHDQQLVFQRIQCWNHEFFGLARQWTPVMCGGMSAAGDPQIPVLSPAALAGYVLGPFWGLRVVSILWFAVGFLAAFLYAGVWLRRREARLLAAALFIGNGFFVCRFGYGHLPFLPFLAFPLLLWAMHRAGPWARAVDGRPRLARWLIAALGCGSLLALQLDGSAQGLVYMLPWIGIYALGLAWARRSVAPVVLYLAGVVLAAFLAAGFLWSLVDSQGINQRLRPDQFTNPLALLAFLLVPFRGNIPGIPTAENGYELSVFLGVIIAWALVRHGRSLLQRLPRDVRVPLLLTTGAAILFGMGSLKPLGVPGFLSPYDWLRELPGFRSIVVTGRYWGFLALPLSLLGAAALWRLACAQRSGHKLAALMLTALGLQLGFQAGTIAPKLMRSRLHEPVATRGMFEGAGEPMRYVLAGDHEFQGEYITPVTGVINCFNLIDFIRPEMEAGDGLIARAFAGEQPLASHLLDARFLTWSNIRITLRGGWPGDAPLEDNGVVRIVLRQAWHVYWGATVGSVEPHARGNLTAVVTRSQLEAGPVDLVFHDRISALGTRVSLVSWPVALLALVLLAPLARRRRSA